MNSNLVIDGEEKPLEEAPQVKAAAAMGNNYSRPEGQNVGNFLTEKSSSRVIQPPGGASQICFGSDDEYASPVKSKVCSSFLSTFASLSAFVVLLPLITTLLRTVCGFPPGIPGWLQVCGPGEPTGWQCLH